MDCTSIQHQHATTAWRKFRAIIHTRAPAYQPSPTTALVALGLFNIPATAAYYITKVLATRRALESWPSSWNARWIAHYFPDKTASLRTDHVSSHVREALQRLTSTLALSPLTLSRKRYWTLLTANFTQFNLAHFAGNMLALNAVAPACARVPGMSAAHVFGLALSTSLTTSAHALYRLNGEWGWKMCGFSAVLCALTSVAALGAPNDAPDDGPGRALEKAQSAWMVAGMQLVSDLVAVLGATRGGGAVGARGGKIESVDFRAHLVGWACGAVYYAIFLWGKDGIDVSRGEISGQQGEDVGEVGSTGRVEGSVRESEDWEEIASKLGYDDSVGETRRRSWN